MKPTETRQFVGGDRFRTTKALPRWYATIARGKGQTVETMGNDSLNGVVQSLPKVIDVPTGYFDPNRDEWIETDRHTALVNPEWLGTDPDDFDPDETPGDALWYIATNAYDPVNPIDMYGPLIAIAKKHGIADGIFGEARLYRYGGEVHLDIFFPSLSVKPRPGTLPEDMENPPELVLGLTTGYDHYTQTPLYSQVIAANKTEKVIYRNLTASRTRTHRKARKGQGKSAKQAAAWWENEIDRMKQVAGTMWQVIADAVDYEIDFADIPFGPEDFYTAHDIPGKVAKESVKRLPATPRPTDSATYSAWDMYAALADALTYTYDGKDNGSALRGHIQTGNKILFKPPSAEQYVLRTWEMDIRKGNVSHPNPNQIADDLSTRRESVEEKLSKYADMKDRLKKMLEEADDADDAGASNPQTQLGGSSNQSNATADTQP